MSRVLDPMKVARFLVKVEDVTKEARTQVRAMVLETAKKVVARLEEKTDETAPPA